MEVSTVEAWFENWLKFDPRAGMTDARWLATSQQLLLEVTAGEVFHDEPGELTRAREVLGWYPTHVWLWLMACVWGRIADEEAVVGRASEAGDDLGSRLATARIVHHAVTLSFLQERRYAPYGKWLGSALSALDRASELTVPMAAALHAPNYGVREEALADVYRSMANRHNALAVTEHVEATIDDYDVGINQAVRPYRVLNARRFVEACRAAIPDGPITGVGLIGSIDQLAPTDEVVHFSGWPKLLEDAYYSMGIT